MKKTSVSYINVPRLAGARSPVLHEHIGCVVVHANVHVRVRVLAYGLTYTHSEEYARARAAALSVRSSRGTSMLLASTCGTGGSPYPVPTWSPAALAFTWVFVGHRNESPPAAC